MTLDTSHDYVFRIGSDNQHRLHWTGKSWLYEFLAGGVLFDSQNASNEQELAEAVAVHGLTVDQFIVDQTGDAGSYSNDVRKKLDEMEALGITPCAKHGLAAKNPDNSCEACNNLEYPDDFKGTEG